MSAPVQPVVHTPGPWRTYDIFGGSYQEVFGPRSPGGDRLQVDGKADAKLIAAAPDLLAALQSCRMHIETLERMHGHELPEGEALRDAIAKATGEVV